MEYIRAIQFRNTVLTAALTFLLAVIHPSCSHQPTKPASSADKIGIDVSHYQGHIDWANIKQINEVHYVFVKTTEGLGFIDPLSRDNFRGLKQAAIPFGSYHFFDPSLDPEQQAVFFIQHAARPLTLPPVLDIEISQGMSPEEIKNAAKTWLLKVEQELGCKPIIYTDVDYWKTNLGPEFNDYKIWLAEYQNKLFVPAGMTTWSIWQYSDDGYVDGINGFVDMNQLNLDLNSLESLLC